jgi:hypothetical protein
MLETIMGMIGMDAKTLPTSYHGPQLDLTMEIVAFKASETEQATS